MHSGGAMLPAPCSPLAPTTPDSDAEPMLLERGTSVGRFMVLELLGMGGMGVVFSAYDPQLDRKVALKLLRADAWGGGEVLRREAQIMARVSHPNVLTVHEIGELGDRGYVVMEYVEGSTLRAWLAERTRPFAEILDAFQQAGAGLAVAHEAGIIHRDFKPENVLVGRDDRPRVSDFGLASSYVPSGAGTAAYMPPEQSAGEEIDARADQYAFCVTLWEALTGERPHASPPLPRVRRAPAWVFRALARGLQASPAARWPSMRALLAALRPKTAPLRIFLASAALLSLTAGAYALGHHEDPAAAACATAEQHLGDAWSTTRRSAVRDAILRNGSGLAWETWTRVSADLDAYSRAWTASYGEACRATHVERRQSEALLDLRMACLERRRDSLAALTSLWSEGLDANGLEHAIDAARALPALAVCADPRALTERVPLPADPTAVERIARARARITGVAALTLANRVEQAKAEATEARREADATGWPEVRAEAALAQGALLTELKDRGAGIVLKEAAHFAAQAHADDLGAAALVALVDHLAEDKQDAAAALAMVEMADLVMRRGGDDAELRTRLYRQRAAALLVRGQVDDAWTAALVTEGRALALGQPRERLATMGLIGRIAEQRGDYQGARRTLEAAVAQAIPLYGEDHPRVAVLYNNLGVAAGSASEYQASETYYRRALAIKLRSLGSESASTATAYNNLGTAVQALARFEEARTLFEQALAIRERVLGPNHPHVATTLSNLAGTYVRLGLAARALPLAERALAIKTAAYGEKHASVAPAFSQLGVVYGALGEHRKDLAMQERALALRIEVLGRAHPTVRIQTGRVAEAHAKLGQCAAARALAMPLLESQASDATEPYYTALQVLGDCDLREHHAVRAIARYRHAAARPVVAADPAMRGMVTWLLGRTLWDTGRTEEGEELVRRAITQLATAPDMNEELETARRWLADKRGGI
jgi:eukaryotic-like serine/threonine-protein kinase